MAADLKYKSNDTLHPSAAIFYECVPFHVFPSYFSLLSSLPLFLHSNDLNQPHRSKDCETQIPDVSRLLLHIIYLFILLKLCFLDFRIRRGDKIEGKVLSCISRTCACICIVYESKYVVYSLIFFPFELFLRKSGLQTWFYSDSVRFLRNGRFFSRLGLYSM